MEEPKAHTMGRKVAGNHFKPTIVLALNIVRGESRNGFNIGRKKCP
jgi:hypothetical protein